jgi:hypothetical protein
MLSDLARWSRQPSGPPRDEQLSVRVRDLADLLRIHVRKEEALVLQLAERVLTTEQLATLASRVTPRESGTAREHSRTRKESHACDPTQ